MTNEDYWKGGHLFLTPTLLLTYRYSNPHLSQMVETCMNLGINMMEHNILNCSHLSQSLLRLLLLSVTWNKTSTFAKNLVPHQQIRKHPYRDWNLKLLQGSVKEWGKRASWRWNYLLATNSNFKKSVQTVTSTFNDLVRFHLLGFHMKRALPVISGLIHSLSHSLM